MPTLTTPAYSAPSRGGVRLTLIVSALIVAGLSGALAACSPAPAAPTPDVEATRLFESALETAQAQIPTATLEPTLTPTPAPTATRTPLPGPPPDLPTVFTSSLIKSNVVGVQYVQETCQYLKDRWNSENALPGTVVMPIMYHSITEDFSEVTEDSQIRHSELERTLRHAKEVGFETITTQQLVDFLDHNAHIPARSLLLIVDDRRPGVVREHFFPYLEEFNWTLTLAWLIGDTDEKPASWLKSYPDEDYKSLWEQMEAYNATGRLDVQAHGYIHNINITDASSDEFMWHELYDSRTVLQQHFYCKDYTTGVVDPNCKTDQPLAYIWPGGSFTKTGIETAVKAGYRIGFTINPRGPILYNWIPQAAEKDPNSPVWLPEIPGGNPLMTLPRYWSTDAAYRIDEVANIGEEAAAEAEKNKPVELEYYAKVCLDQTGPIPGVELP